MKKIMKKFISSALAIALMIGLLPTYVSAENSLTYDLVLNKSSVTNESAQTVTINVNLDSPVEACSVQYTVTCPDGITIESVSAAEGSSCTISSVSYNSAKTQAIVSWDTETEDDMPDITIQDIGVITVGIPAGTEPDDYTITISGIEITNGYALVFVEEAGSLEATISVTDPNAGGDEGGEDSGTTTTGDFEIWYELDRTTDEETDADPDGYKEYGIDDTITATVYLKNNSENAVDLQAYDIYLEYPEQLIYQVDTLDGVAYQTVSGATDTDAILAGKGDKVTHIQLVSDNAKIKSLPVGTKVPLGTIEFIFADSAVYNTNYGITLTEGTSGQKVTNIAVGLDKQSFYPDAIQTIDGVTYSGAEVNSKYTVTYNAGTNGKFANDAVTVTETVGYGMNLSVPALTVDTGYTLGGWYNADDKLVDTASYVVKSAVTLTAKYTANTFTVNWYKQDGTLIKTDENVAYGTALKDIAPNAPEKEDNAQYDYEFAGWATDANKTEGTLTANLGIVDGDKNFYAAYSENLRKYTVTWYNQAGTAVLKTDTYDYDTDLSKEAPEAPDKTDTAQYDYEFVGWATDANKTEGTPTANLGVVDGAKEYYAAYSETLRSYDVTINYNGHGGTNTTNSMTYGSKVTEPTTTTVKGYTFGGWYTDKDCTDGKEYNFDAEITGTTVIYAKWTPYTYTVVFDKNHADATGTMNNQPFKYDEEKALSANEFVRTGWVFAGWAKDPDATTPDYTTDPVVNLSVENGGTVTLYAVWTQDAYSIIYTHNPTPVTTVSNMPPALTYSNTTGLKITNQPTADGYTFAGWTCDELNITTPAKTIEIPANTAKNVTLVANWTPVTYTITYDLDGGSVATNNPESYTVVNDNIILTNPTKTGYIFAGWTGTDLDAATKDVTIAKGSTGDRSYVATWTPENYTISYNLDGGSVATNNPTSYTIETATFTLTNPTKTGYTFAGWTGTGLNEATKEVTIANGSTGNRSYTATWTENQYTITYDQSDDEVNYADDVDTEKTVGYDDSVTLPTKDQVTKPGYELTGWTTDPNVKVGDTPEFTGTAEKLSEGDESVTLYPVWKYVDYTVTINSVANGTVSANKTTAVHVGEEITLTATPEAGYGWTSYTVTYGENQTVPVNEGNFIMPAANVTVTATFSPIQYTITFNVDGGADLTGGDTYFETNKMYYDITDTDALPTTTKGLYSFAGWEVIETSEANGGWAVGSVITNGSLDKNYGNVTLKAVWEIPFTYEVEDYRYAPDGYVMLRIATESAANCYSFKYAEEKIENMYYTADGNYTLQVEGKDKSVFVTLIPKADGDVALIDANNQLTAAGMAKLNKGEATATTINHASGDINGDSVVNIADANVIYQMTQYEGKYYTLAQLDILHRLMADMETDRGGTEELHRGSIEDVNEIVNKINGVTPATN